MEQIRALNADIEMRAGALSFTRWAMALAQERGRPVEAARLFEARWPRSKHGEMVRKAAVLPGSTTGWGQPLLELQPLASAFVSYLAPRTIIGRLQGMRVVPFNVKIPRATSSAAVEWIGQSHVKPASAVSYESIQFTVAKVAGLVVVSTELLRSSDPAVEGVIRDDLVNAAAGFLDRQFLDPDVTEVADVSPGSVTSTATTIASGGSTAAQVEADIAELIGSVAANSNLANPYLIAKPTVAAYLASLRTTGGQAVFPNAGVAGGSIMGIPLLTSINVPSSGDSPDSHLVVALDASEIFYADNGARVSVSEHTSVQMTTTPDSPESASTVGLNGFAVGGWSR
jgi:hypothetical protein